MNHYKVLLHALSGWKFESNYDFVPTYGPGLQGHTELLHERCNATANTCFEMAMHAASNE